MYLRDGRIDRIRRLVEENATARRFADDVLARAWELHAGPLIEPVNISVPAATVVVPA